MNKNAIKECETKYFVDISRHLNVHQLVSLIQYGADADDENENGKLLEREEAAKEGGGQKLGLPKGSGRNK